MFSEYKNIKLAEVLRELKVKETSYISIIGNFGNGNMGDELLLKSVVQNLFENEYNNVFAFARDVNLVQNNNSQLNIVKPSLSGLFNLIKSDVIVIGPGGLFGKDIGPFAQLIPIITLMLKFFGKKVFYYGFGIYSETPTFIKYLVAVACFFADGVYVRDKHSFNLLKNFSLISKKIQLILDPAFHLFETKEPQRRSKMKKIKTIGLSLRYIENIEYRQRIINIFADVINNIPNMKLVPLIFFIDPENLKFKRTHPSDSVMIAKIYEKANFEEKSNPELNLEKLVEQYEYLDAVIAMRFHAQVIAICHNLPLLGIGYSPKNEICKDYPKSFFVKENHIDYLQVKEFIDSI